MPCGQGLGAKGSRGIGLDSASIARARGAVAPRADTATASFVLPDLAPGAIRELRAPDATDEDDE
jgi:hypothetical protein